MRTSQRLIGEVRTSRYWFGLTVLLSLFAGGLIIFQAHRLSSLVNGVFMAGQSRQAVAAIFGLLGLIILFRAVIAALNGSAAGMLAAGIKRHLRLLLLEKIERLGPSFTSGEATGELTTTTLQGVDSLDAYFSQYLPQILVAALLPTLILLVVFPIDAITGLIFLVTAPLIPFFMWLIGKASENETRRQWLALSRLGSYFLDTLQGITTLKALGQSKARTQQVREVSDAYRETTLRVLRITFLSALTLEMLATISTAVVAVEIGLRLLAAKIAFEQAFFILLLAPEFYLPLRALGARFHAGMSGVSAAKRIYEVLDTPEPDQNIGIKEQESFILPQSFKIRFSDVSFAYADRDQDSLKGMNLTLESGKLHGLIGASGCGKSTLMQLLLRFIEPTAGRIFVDGNELNSIHLEDWRRQISWVPQKPGLLSASILENIRLARPDASLREVQAAAERAQLHQLVMSLPKGYDTPLYEQAGGVSSGQAQRIALARAFLKDAPILLLDEPAAHLDIELERELNHAIEDLIVGRTVLMIAHRLSTIMHCDQLILLDCGSLSAAGTPSELLRTSLLYRTAFAERGGRG